uniref:Glutathione S-transferase n=1 Tax=Glossina morsitans morsitans TaxID=37546 RepID=A0A1B0GC83_GLOMM
MKSVLYFDKCSPPVRSCLMLMKHLDIDIELKKITLFKREQLRSDFKEINPAHTVPTLIDGDLILTDSHAILIHFCEKYQKDEMNLWPKEYNERMKVLNMLLFEISIVFRRDSNFLSEVVHKSLANVDVPYHKEKILESYDMLEKYLGRHKFIATEYLTIADFSVVTTLSTANIMFPIDEIQWPLLYKWLEYMKTLPEYDINVEGLEELRNWMELFGKFKFPIEK